MRVMLIALVAPLCFATAWAQETPADPPAASGEVVVPGAITRPVAPVPADPRTSAQRMRDIRSWDRCVMRAQAASDTDPTRFQEDSPEDLCRRSLGMPDRESLPLTRN